MTTYYTGSTVESLLTVTPYDTDTTATLTVTGQATGATITLLTGPSPVGDTRDRWRALWIAPAPGDYHLVWTVTGTGAGVRSDTVHVTPLPADTPAGLRVYATTADYARWVHAAPPVGAVQALAAASRVIDELLLAAVYDVDAAGMPTKAAHITALRDATCAQAAYAAATGDRLAVGAGHISQASIGSVSFQRGGATGGEAPGRYSPQAWAILQQAGLTGHEPQAPWSVW